MDDTMPIALMTGEDLVAAFNETKQKMENAIRQIAYLDIHIKNLRKLYHRAEKNNKHAVRYNLRMQLAIASGVKLMYHRYAIDKKNTFDRIQIRVGQLESPESVAVYEVETNRI